MQRNTMILGGASLGLAAVLAVAGAGWGAIAGDPLPANETATVATASAGTPITVYKTATCGCCKAWVTHLRDNGFTVKAIDVQQTRLNDIKQRSGLTRELASCHTAQIGPYTVEGHVPASDIRELLEQSPEAAGLTVPGMPLGSPGMDMGGRSQPYEVLSYGGDSRTRVFSRYEG